MTTTRNAAETVVRNAAPGIMEHWDVLQILVSRTVGHTTESFAYGCGNWFAQCGLLEYIQSKNNENGRVEFREQHLADATEDTDDPDPFPTTCP